MSAARPRPAHRRWIVASALLFAAPLFAASPARAHGLLHERIADVSARIAASPTDAQLLLERAELHRLHGELEAARVDLDRAARLDPLLPGVALCRGVLELEAGQPEAAVRSLRGCIARAPHDGDAAWWLGRALGAAGDRAEAAQVLKRALPELARATPGHYLELAEALRAADAEDREEAARWLRRGISALGPVASLQSALANLGSSDPRPAPNEGASASSGAAAIDASAATAIVSKPGSDPSATATSAATQVLVTRRGSWRYFAGSSANAPGPGWTTPTFDDSQWAWAAMYAGYGDPFIVTTVPYGGDAAAKWITTYFRTTFDLPSDPEGLQRLALWASYDDGMVVHLNGQEVVRRAMPAGPVTWGTLAINHGTAAFAYELVDLTPALGALVQGTNVLAIEVHQSTAGSSDLALDAELVASPAAALLLRGPYLQVATPTSLVVRWRTDIATDSRVRFGGAPGGLFQSVVDPALTTEHELQLTGLDPDTRYFYAVGSTAADLVGDDSGHTFVTPPVAGTVKPTRVWVLGDSGGAGVETAAVRDAYVAATGSAPTDLWLMLGDNAYYSGTDLEYQAAVFEMFPQMLRTVCLWPTRGNHELLHAGSNNDYYDIFTLPTLGQAGGEPSGDEAYYSFDYANIHFVCLDSEGSSRAPAGAMLDWLDRDLAATTQRWKVAFWHHPPYSKGSHDSDIPTESGGRQREMRENALPILEAGGVDLVLCGHSHSYERSCLLKGHFGVSSTLQPQMKLDPGDGRYGGDGPYRKPVAGQQPDDGTVYVVAGSSTFTGGGSLNHPVMIASLNLLGSLVLEVDGDRLDATFLTSAGGTPDGFTLLKGEPIGVGDHLIPGPGASLGLFPAWPNPFAGRTTLRYSLPQQAHVQLTIVDARGRRVATLVSQVQEPGEHAAHWNARDDHGRPVAAGVYTTLLRVDGQRRTGKTIVVR